MASKGIFTSWKLTTSCCSKFRQASAHENAESLPKHAVKMQKRLKSVVLFGIHTALQSKHLLYTPNHPAPQALTTCTPKTLQASFGCLTNFQAVPRAPRRVRVIQMLVALLYFLYHQNISTGIVHSTGQACCSSGTSLEAEGHPVKQSASCPTSAVQ